ncbi:DUF397 domain-containing protein [Streptomyces spiramyceticus]|uniref:DUF397 domain-containing protein n=1 Tax=Streptomyces spiramyceticus TaxID=299717 RepID=UPI003B75CCF0
MAVRDSKNPTGPALVLTTHRMSDLLHGARPAVHGLVEVAPARFRSRRPLSGGRVTAA